MNRGGTPPRRSGRRGLWYGVGAYGIWGLFPIYWKLIEFVPATQIIAHRIVWSFLLLILVRAAVAARGQRVEPLLGSRRTVGLYAAAAMLIATGGIIAQLVRARRLAEVKAALPLPQGARRPYLLLSLSQPT